jgi:hypothetical protein
MQIEHRLCNFRIFCRRRLADVICGDLLLVDPPPARRPDSVGRSKLAA